MQTTGLAKVGVMSIPDRPGTAGHIMAALGKKGINVQFIVQCIDIHNNDHVVLCIAQEELDLARKILSLAGNSSTETTPAAGSDDDRIAFVSYDQAYEEGFEDMRRRAPDIGKINAMIGWKPESTLDETLQRVIEFYRNQ